MNVYHINALAGMRLFLADASVDAIVTDPPYELTAARPGGRSEATRGAVMGGFMGMKWDGTGIAFSVELWREALRVLKPGGHLLAFSGSRTYHRMACAIEDAGFDIRDQIMWVYASGMPKSFNLAREVGKSICGCATGTLPCTHENTEPQTECHVRPVRNANVPPAESHSEERREILQPGVPQQGAPMHGAEPREGRHGGGESGLAGRRDAVQAQGELQGHPVHSGVGVAAPDGAERRLHNGAPGRDGGMVRLPADPNGGGAPRRPRSDEQPARQSGTVADEQLAQAAGAWPLCPGCGLPVVPEGLGTALKPAHEPICVARKPLVGTVAANVLAHGTGALNIDGCRVEVTDAAYARNCSGDRGHAGTRGADQEGATDLHAGGGSAASGRWPANLIHDGSDDVLAAFPSAPGQQGALTGNEPSARAGAVDQNCYGTMDRRHAAVPRREEDRSAARFFYCAKASKADRGPGNDHPTVKPSALMQYLVRLVTPPGGHVLDPFNGSGTTALACQREGFSYTGFDLDAHYVEITRARLAAG